MKSRGLRSNCPSHFQTILRMCSNSVVAIIVCLLLMAQHQYLYAQQSTDLVAMLEGEFTVSPMVLSPSGTITLSRWWVRNAGNSTVTFTVGLYVSADPIINRSDRSIVRRKHTLKAGETETWRDLPHSLCRLALESGAYYVGILVDDDDTVFESNEANNVLVIASPMTIRILPPVKADLIPGSSNLGGPLVFAPGDIRDAVAGQLMPPNVAPGGTLLLNGWQVTNSGTQDAPGFRVGYYLSNDATITREDTLLGCAGISELRAGETYRAGIASGELQLKEDIVPGDYFVGILVNDLNEVGELPQGSATNNFISTPVRVLRVASDKKTVFRVEIKLTTGTGSNHGTNDGVYVSLNSQGNKTWLDYTRNDFERGHTDRYDLVLNNVNQLGDIQKIEIGKDGTDGLCIKKVELFVNRRLRMYTSNFTSCRWLDTNTARTITIPYSSLRRHSDWQNFGTVIPEELKQDDILSLIQAYVGDGIHGQVEWNGIHGQIKWRGPVTVRKKSEDTIGIKLGFRAEIPGPDMTADGAVDLSISCQCGGIRMDFSKPQVTVDSHIASEVLTLGFINLLDRFLSKKLRDELGEELHKMSQSFHTGLGLCPTISVSDQVDVKFTLPEIRNDLKITTDSSDPLPTVRPGEAVVVKQIISNGDRGNVHGVSFHTESYLASSTSPLPQHLSDLIPSAVSLGHTSARQSKCDEALTIAQEVRLPATLQCTAYAPGSNIPAVGKQYYLLSHIVSLSDVYPSDNIMASVLHVGLPDLELSARVERLNRLPGRTSIVFTPSIRNRGVFQSGAARYRAVVSRTPSIDNVIKWFPPREIELLLPGNVLSMEREQLNIDDSEMGRLPFFVGIYVDQLDGQPECDLKNNYTLLHVSRPNQ